MSPFLRGMLSIADGMASIFDFGRPSGRRLRDRIRIDPPMAWRDMPGWSDQPTWRSPAPRTTKKP